VGLLEHLEVAEEKPAGMFVAEMEAVALAVFIGFAGGTGAGTGPGAVAHVLVAFVPYGPEVIGIYIALNVVGT